MWDSVHIYDCDWIGNISDHIPFFTKTKVTVRADINVLVSTSQYIITIAILIVYNHFEKITLPKTSKADRNE